MTKIVSVDTDYEKNDVEAAMAEEAGVEYAVFHDPSPEGIIKNARDADGVLTAYGEFTEEVFAALAPKLKVVSRCGVGYDTVDIEAATKYGVAVCNVPGYATEVVSDHAIALTLAVLRRINEVDADMRKGTWDYARHRPLGQVKGRTFGVVGMGHIGTAAAKKARGLGFEVVCCSHSLEPGSTTPDGFKVLSFDDLLKQADVVSFHTALTEDNRHMLDGTRLALMKKDAIVVNTARGALIDTVALAQALEAGVLWGAGIDVFEEEPLPADHPLFKAPNTVLSPHDAYWSEESGAELRQRSMQHAIDGALGKRPANCLNPSVFS